MQTLAAIPRNAHSIAAFSSVKSLTDNGQYFPSPPSFIRRPVGPALAMQGRLRSDPVIRLICIYVGLSINIVGGSTSNGASYSAAMREGDALSRMKCFSTRGTKNSLQIGLHVRLYLSFLPRDATQSAVVVCLPVCLSVCQMQSLFNTSMAANSEISTEHSCTINNSAAMFCRNFHTKLGLHVSINLRVD